MNGKKKKKSKVGNTNRVILLTSESTFHLSLRLSRYSIAARSRAVITPSLSDALAFHILTFPSSEPVSTNLASAENMEDDILMQKKKRLGKPLWRDFILFYSFLPLHSFGMIDFG
jgi:hypothetical protein